jgi:hypothetical protein
MCEWSKSRILFFLLFLLVLLTGCSKDDISEPNLSNVILTIDDLPGNFQNLPMESLEKIGFGQNTLTTAFQGAFTNAQPHNFTAYMSPDANQVEVILSMLFSPLSQDEVQAWDAQVDNPEQAVYDFSVGMGVDSQSQIKPEYSGIGDKSIGFISNHGGFYMETLLVRRNRTVSLFLLMYMNSTQLDLRQMATVMDQRLVTGYQ